MATVIIDPKDYRYARSMAGLTQCFDEVLKLMEKLDNLHGFNLNEDERKRMGQFASYVDRHAAKIKEGGDPEDTTIGRSIAFGISLHDALVTHFSAFAEGSLGTVASKKAIIGRIHPATLVEEEPKITSCVEALESAIATERATIGAGKKGLGLLIIEAYQNLNAALVQSKRDAEKAKQDAEREAYRAEFQKKEVAAAENAASLLARARRFTDNA